MGAVCRVLPLGDTAILAEVAGIEEVLALKRSVNHAVAHGSSDPESVWFGVTDVVPAARTLMVVTPLRTLDRGQRSALGDALLALAHRCLSEDEPVVPDEHVGAGAGRVVEIPVRYDGPDLHAVAELTGLSVEEVIAAHTGTDWVAAFGGFAPGFSYLVGGDPTLQVPRRPEPRTKVPAGAVALAGEFSAIYPRASPGGWQLIGTTSTVLWDCDREQPALIAPGARVRFVVAESAVGAPDAEVGPGGRATEASTHGGRPGAGAAPRHTGNALEVLRAGGRALVEDLGRFGAMASGVGHCGAADRAAHCLGARLVGQQPSRASLEITNGHAAFRAHGSLLLCLTGAPVDATVDGKPAPHAAPFPVDDGSVLELGPPRSGLRTYLGVRGGIRTPKTLGSRSADTMSGLGPPALTEGDLLPVGRAPRRRFPLVDAAPVAAPPEGPVTLPLLRGPRLDWFADPARLNGSSWEVSSRSDRVGIRLDGPALTRTPERVDAELPSEGMVRGCLQVPPSGHPVLFLSDHPVTGGYPVIGVLPSAAVDRAAQLRPGQRVNFTWAD